MNVQTIHAMKTLSVIIPLEHFLVHAKATTLEMDLIALVCYMYYPCLEFFSSRLIKNFNVVGMT